MDVCLLFPRITRPSPARSLGFARERRGGARGRGLTFYARILLSKLISTWVSSQ